MQCDPDDVKSRIRMIFEGQTEQTIALHTADKNSTVVIHTHTHTHTHIHIHAIGTCTPLSQNQRMREREVLPGRISFNASELQIYTFTESDRAEIYCRRMLPVNSSGQKTNLARHLYLS